MPVRVHTSDERKFMMSGYNFLDSLRLASENIPTEIATDPYTCPFAYDGCLGAKDPEYHTRCTGRSLPFLRCDIHNIKISDTQVRVQLSSTARARKPKRASPRDSIDDGLDEGAPIQEVAGFGGALRFRSSGPTTKVYRQ
jgi:hypothetical protein